VRAVAALKDDAPVEEIQEAANAYLAVLDATLAKLPKRMLDMLDTPTHTDRTSSGNMTRLYEILVAIVDIMNYDQEKHFHVGKTCSMLQSRGLIQDNCADVLQLVFILFGALTMLYTPRSGSRGR
jgi:hypothetical protein